MEINNSKIKVQFILKKNQNVNFKGKKAGLFNSANFVVNFLQQQGNFEVDIADVVDSNEIDKVVTAFNPDIVIIEALWVPPSKFLELFSHKRHSNRKWVVRIHSKAPFLANEGIATKWVKEYCDISSVIISPNTEELTNQFKVCFPHGNFLYLPNIYTASNIELPEKIVDEKIINIGCFGAIRPLKNHYSQAIAAIEFAGSINKKLHFHINSSRTEQNGDNVLKNVEAIFSVGRHELIKHPWYDHDDFVIMSSKLDLGMQVSFTESFNIVTADLISAKVPMIVSDDIDWMPLLQRVSPTAHNDIVNKLKLAYNLPSLFITPQENALKYYNAKSEKIWLTALK